MFQNASAYAGLDKNICLGDSVRLDGVAIGSYTWQPTTAMSDTTQIKPFVKPNNDIKYVLTATLGSCLQRDTVESFCDPGISQCRQESNRMLRR
jgi:hypothetical protein